MKYLTPKYLVIANPQSGPLRSNRLWASLNIMMLIIANTECRTIKERDCGITLKISSRKNYAQGLRKRQRLPNGKKSDWGENASVLFSTG